MTEKPLARILVPVDLSEPARSAVTYVAELSPELCDSVDLLHVLRPPREMAAARAALRALPGSPTGQRIVDYLALLEGRGFARVRALIELGDPVEAIVTLSESGDYDLIVMGSQPLTGLSRFVATPPAEQVLRRAGCPVITVSPGMTPAHLVSEAPDQKN